MEKEWIAFLRSKSNHLLVLIITIGAGVTKFLIDENFNKWFLIGLCAIIILLIAY